MTSVTLAKISTKMTPRNARDFSRIAKTVFFDTVLIDHFFLIIVCFLSAYQRIPGGSLFVHILGKQSKAILIAIPTHRNSGEFWEGGPTRAGTPGRGVEAGVQGAARCEIMGLWRCVMNE
jgi:hypothetical protein